MPHRNKRFKLPLEKKKKKEFFDLLKHEEFVEKKKKKGGRRILDSHRLENPLFRGKQKESKLHIKDLTNNNETKNKGSKKRKKGQEAKGLIVKTIDVRFDWGLLAEIKKEENLKRICETHIVQGEKDDIAHKLKIENMIIKELKK